MQNKAQLMCLHAILKTNNVGYLYSGFVAFSKL